ncbi:MAG: hypothetical protein IJE45_01835 [Bacilli bacterium]|nr:hypothetical protein [Bacilli bacterium]
MKKKLFVLFFMFVLTIALTSCGKKEEETARVTLDTNPSYELIIDEEKTVIAVTALNEDASIVLYGESLVGKSLEEATEVIINLTVEYGYQDDTVKLSISEEYSNAKKVIDEMKKTIKETLDEKNITATIETVTAYTQAQLAEYVEKYSVYTLDELKEKTETELLNILSESRNATKQLIDVTMQELYYESLKYQEVIEEKETILKEFEAKTDGFILETYKTALELYQNTMNQVVNLKYRTLLAPDSVYQMTLKKAIEGKVAINEQKKYVESLPAGNVKETATASLNELIASYEGYLVALENTKVKAEAEFDKVISLMETYEEQLIAAEDAVVALLGISVEEIVNDVEIKANEYYQSFVEEYKNDIAQYEEFINAQKAKLEE